MAISSSSENSQTMLLDILPRSPCWFCGCVCYYSTPEGSEYCATCTTADNEVPLHPIGVPTTYLAAVPLDRELLACVAAREILLGLMQGGVMAAAEAAGRDPRQEALPTELPYQIKMPISRLIHHPEEPNELELELGPNEVWVMEGE